MLATHERVRTESDTTVLVWHKSDGHCDGQCDFHPIACSDTDGIVLPGPTQDVPLNLDKPGESWCPDCLALIRADHAVEGRER
ncbi:hypothetical protein KVH30_02320 [Streptomyces olivaceus]|uniref:hypothetical protein n=1 Tax=Streptomyces olivaceus TaxID=47716 RepID=UPI001CC94AE1|nr:hypothetical protein [Streptomyces olivaceus]MBZ6290408.1 hypothetical protein [Streptomyces olivaceus]MBZ6324360.1 hypothetical protein [Streptomyces olivaceus]